MTDENEPGQRSGSTADAPEPVSVHPPDVNQQIAALLDIVASQARSLRRLEREVGRIGKKSRAEPGEHEPGAWVWFSPPAAAEDDPDRENDPRWTVDNFVAWYNITFVGVDGSRARPIPPCWQEHPGLAMEVASLAYTWRAANIGPDAHPRDNQYWLHQWRPGFTDRLAREWVAPDCLDGNHRPGLLDPRPDRYTIAEQAAALSLPGPPKPTRA